MTNTSVKKIQTEDWPDHRWKMQNAARFYAAMGWLVFPVRMTDKTPLTKNGHHDATTNRKQIDEWWTRWPNAGIGLACGKLSGWAVIDIDVKNDAPGWDNAKALTKQYGKFTSGLQVITPSDGIHRYFPHEELPFKCNASKLAEGIDLRSSDIDGNGSGYVILPPSRAVVGEPYEWGDTDETPRQVPDEIAWGICFSSKERLIIDRTSGLKDRIMSRPREEWYAEYAITRSFMADGIKLLASSVVAKIAGLTLDTPYCRKAVDDELARLGSAKRGEQDTTLTSVSATLGSLAAGLGLDQKSTAVSDLTKRLREEALSMHSYDASEPWDGPQGIAEIGSKIERQFFGWGYKHPRDLSNVQAGGMKKKERDAGTLLATEDETPDKDKAGKREIKLTWLDTVEPEATDWLWPKRIVRGGLNMISGDPAQGKSQLSCDIAARTTTGEPWPGQSSKASLRKPERVIIINAEDKTKNDIVPRLIAAGADLKRVATIDSVLKYDEQGRPVSGFLSLQEDITSLDAKLAKTPDVALIIIDPISAYLGTAKSHNDAEVRGVLGPLSKLAEKHNVAILYIAHLNKGGDGKAVYRTQGSIAFVAAARSAFGVSIHPEDVGSDTPRRIFGPVKCNYSQSVLSQEFEVVSAEVKSAVNPLPINTSRIQWLGKSEISLEDAMKANGKEMGKQEKAQTWLSQYLQDDEAAASQVYKDGKIEGFSERTLWRAADKLGIKHARRAYQGKSMWRLP